MVVGSRRPARLWVDQGWCLDFTYMDFVRSVLVFIFAQITTGRPSLPPLRGPPRAPKAQPQEHLGATRTIGQHLQGPRASPQFTQGAHIIDISRCIPKRPKSGSKQSHIIRMIDIRAETVPHGSNAESKRIKILFGKSTRRSKGSRAMSKRPEAQPKPSK